MDRHRKYLQELRNTLNVENKIIPILFCGFEHWEDSVAIGNRRPREGNRIVKEDSKLGAF